MKCRNLLMILMMLYAYASAQEPKPYLTRTEWALLTADAGVRAVDVYSTRRMLEGGNHEKFLPSAIAHHTPAMAAYSGACVYGNYLLMRRLQPHHPKLARMVPLIDIGQDGFWAFHNLTLRGSR